MLTFEPMMSFDPAMGGFASGAGASGVGAAASGNPAAASGQFADQLSGVMSNGSQDAGGVRTPSETAPATEGSGSVGKGAAAGFDITLQMSDEAGSATTSEAAFVQGALGAGNVPVDLAAADAAIDGEGLGEGEVPAEGETPADELAAALASGLAVNTGVAAPAGPASAVADGEIVVADEAGGSVDPLAAGKANAADGDDELELPTFFPSGGRVAGGTAADGGAVGKGGEQIVTGEQNAPGPAKAEARADLSALSADEVAAAADAASDGEVDTEADAALRALLADSKGGAGRQTSDAPSARVAMGEQAAADGRTGTVARSGDDLAARAPQRLVGGVEQGAAAGTESDAVDEAVVSVKATRSNGTSATTTTDTKNTGTETTGSASAGIAATGTDAARTGTAGGAAADGNALQAAATKAIQRIVSGQAGETEAEVPVDEASEGDAADEGASARLKGVTPRTDEQAAAKLASGKVVTAGERLAGEGDPRISNFSSASDVSEEGEVSLKTSDKAAPELASASGETRKTADVLTSLAAMAGAATQANVDGDETKSMDPLTLGTTIDPAATSSRSTDTQAARLAQTAQGTASSLPTAMVAAEIARNAQRGVSRFEIRLDPPELGRVDVHLKINDDGKVQAHLVVERRDTLDMLMRDQRGMERALENAGLKTNADGGLQFSLKDQGQNSAGTNGSPDGNGTQAAGLDNDAAVGEVAEQTSLPEHISAYSRNGANGIDIRI
ncbi:flagellar hook-length control protein FliK [Breoghania sp.]|uniref:flagellar hook-length control protein FliK n=1 Tax=Breoghania sp. TaxID=2065378 RepID=UPI002AA937C7|nr:flagellar hook-length control protein FliK [Breoghania sp.]